MPDHVPSVPGGPPLRTVAVPRGTNAGGAIFGGGRCRRWTWPAARAGDTPVAVRIETWTRGRAGGGPLRRWTRFNSCPHG